MPEPRGPLKWRDNDEWQLPCRLLSGVCILVGGVHFVASHLKADFVLVTLIVICFAPWMGHVFESIGKDGVKFRGVKQGEDASEPTVPKAAILREQARQALGTPTTTSETGPAPPTMQPNAISSLVDNAMTAILNPPFAGMSADAKKILATLWKYQRIHVPRPFRKRWTFIVGSQSPDYVAFIRGTVELGTHYLVGIGKGGQITLTNEGLAYCEKNDGEVSAYPQTYDYFDN